MFLSYCGKLDIAIRFCHNHLYNYVETEASSFTLRIVLPVQEVILDTYNIF